MAAREVVVVSAVRTAVGDYGGALEGHPADATGGARPQGSDRPGQGRSGAGRTCVLRSCHQYRAARHVPVARGHDRLRPAQGGGRGQRQPPLRQRPAGDHLGRAIDPARRYRRRRRRRSRVDDARALHPSGPALGCADGRCQGARHDGRGAVRSVRYRSHGHHGRERRRAPSRSRARIRTNWHWSSHQRAAGRRPKGASSRRSSRSR